MEVQISACSNVIIQTKPSFSAYIRSLLQVSESATSTASSTLKQAGPKARREGRSGLTAEERNRLTSTLEEIERERWVAATFLFRAHLYQACINCIALCRVELAVNLPKLEPFLSRQDEGTQESGDSDHWTPTPSPSPSPSPAAVAPNIRAYRGFSPITESSAERHVAGHAVMCGGKRVISPLLTPPASQLVTSHSSPTTPTSLHEFPLPCK